jgi:hypothetical protein
MMIRMIIIIIRFKLFKRLDVFKQQAQMAAHGQPAAVVLRDEPGAQQGTQLLVLFKRQNLGECRHKARLDLRQVCAERVGSVQFLRFPLDGIDAQTFVANAAEGRIVVEVAHPQMAVQARIGAALAAALAEDLAQS